tara:strand:- start:318 stop:458 length:141 start_codon:yes stop_codon:yes gene_type:complete
MVTIEIKVDTPSEARLLIAHLASMDVHPDYTISATMDLELRIPVRD